jgi:hypothetical protein
MTGPSPIVAIVLARFSPLGQATLSAFLDALRTLVP